MHFNVYCQNINDSWFQNTRGDLDVYYGIVDSLADMVPVSYNNLSDHEKKRADRFKHKSDYNCYISVHALLRFELSKLMHTEARLIRIEESLNGKPFTSDVDIPFSLSRTNNSFAFVIGRSSQSLGIDIERIKPGINFTSISQSYFSSMEQQLVFSFDRIADQNQAFFEIWTRKEALLKAIGIGINTELSKVQVLEGENQIEIGEVKNDTSTFKISTITKNMLIISIASSVDFVPRFKELSLSHMLYP
jgi:4'-phosphopantetheinyl transferase